MVRVLFATASSGWTVRNAVAYLNFHQPSPATRPTLLRRWYQQLIQRWHHALRHRNETALRECIYAWSFYIHQQRLPADIHRAYHNFLAIPQALRISVDDLAQRCASHPHPDGLVLTLGSLLARQALTSTQASDLTAQLQGQMDHTGFLLALRRLLETVGDAGSVLMNSLDQSLRASPLLKAFIAGTSTPKRYTKTPDD